MIMNVAQFLSFSGDNMRESDHVLTALRSTMSLRSP
jgi:hypothetical protein